MPFDSLSDFKARNDYKSAFKDELKKVKERPVPFVYFEKFRFDNGPGPLVLLGKVSKTLIDEVKQSGAAYKAQGRCVKTEDAFEFAPKEGKVPQDKLEVVLKLVNESGKVVAKLGAGADEDDDFTVPKAEGEVVKELPVAADADFAKKAKTNFAGIMKVFDAVKSGFTDDERKAYRIDIGAAHDDMEAGKHRDALKKMAALQEKLAKELRGAQARSEIAAEKKLSEAEAVHEESGKAEQALARMTDDLRRIEQRMSGYQTRLVELKSLPKGMTPKQRDAQVISVTKQLEDDSKRLGDKKMEIAPLAKALSEKKDLAKGLVETYLALTKKTEAMLKLARAEVGKIADNPEQQAAAEAVQPTAQKMAEASQWQNAEVKRREAGEETHGTGRHGAQSGLERQTRRAATGGRVPDSEKNPAGVAQHTAKWNEVTFTYEVDANGKKTLKDRVAILKEVVAKATEKVKTTTASMFANPVLEKEAVDKAVQIAAAKCPWTQVQSGAAWEDLLELKIRVGPPSSAPGFGYTVKLIDQTKKTAVVNADAILKRFEKGEIELDELMSQLNVEIAKDATGAGAKMTPYANVTLRRATPASEWKSFTHFPDENIAAPGWSIEGKMVRRNAASNPEVASFG